MRRIICPKCGGSGGGDDPVLRCNLCQGSGLTANEEARPLLARVYSTCGRYVLEVAGIVVAMQGDKCRYNGFPEEVLPPIPPEELERATIGGKPCKDLPLDVVRFFRGDCWTEKMLRYTAEQINREADTGHQ